MALTQLDLAVQRELGAFKAEIENLKRRQEEAEQEHRDELARMEAECRKQERALKAELEKRIRPLELWKATCDTLAKGWGWLVLAVSSLFTLLASYWEDILRVANKLQQFFKP